MHTPRAGVLERLTSEGRARPEGFTLVETVIALAIVAIGLLGAFGSVLQAGKLVSAAEEDALVSSGLEQRIDKLRMLEWTELTDGTGITNKVWAARPEATTGLTVSETLTLSAYDLTNAKTLNATWPSTGGRTATLTSGTQDLSAAGAVRATATLTWIGRRSTKPQTRSVITVIARGGISKSDPA